MVALAQNAAQYEDAVVVTMEPGHAPGEYIYYETGDITAPRCFAVGPKGMYYVPEVSDEVGHRGYVRLHRFDENGTFLDMLTLEERGSDVRNILIAPDGDIYLRRRAPQYEVGHYVARFSSTGQLIYRLGSEGVIPNDEDFSPPLPDGSLFKSVDDLQLDAGGRLHVMLKLTGRPAQEVSSAFDVATGSLVARHVARPERIVSECSQLKAKANLLREQGESLGLHTMVMDPHGRLYYMTVTAEKLEIHQVAFSEE